MKSPTNRARLGRGIDALLQGRSIEHIDAGATVAQLAIDQVYPNENQPRRKFAPETLQELADSIREMGVLQPILVEQESTERYCIVAGERRYRAAQQAGLRHIPALVRQFSDTEKLEVALVENLQREDLSPIEQAQAFQSLMEIGQLTQAQLAERLGISRSAVANMLRLLKLPQIVQDDVHAGTISAGHARAILTMDDGAARDQLVSRIRAGGVTVREAERNAADVKSKRSAAELHAVGERIMEHLGTRVNIRGSGDHGRIEISYFSLDDLDRLYRLICDIE